MNSKATCTEGENLDRNQLIEYNRRRRMEKTETVFYFISLIHIEFSVFRFNQLILKYSQRTYLSLSSNDRTLLANILHAYEKTCVSLKFHKLLKMPNDNTLSLQKFMNSFTHMYKALIDYFKYIPEFSNLSIEIKISLLKSNFNQTFLLNNALIIHATGVVDNINSVEFKNVFPIDLFIELNHCAMGLNPIRYDVNKQIIPTKTILSIQNFYIELLWRCILYRCSTYRGSVRLLTSFITRLLHSQIVSEKLSEYINERTSNHADQLKPIMKSMWLKEKN